MTSSEPVTAFAPARVDLSAGFTDVEPFCTEVPGRVVNVAMDVGVEVTVATGPASSPAVTFADRLCEAIAHRLAIPRPAVRVATSEIPAGSGMGSSGALSVSLAYALSVRAGSSLKQPELVDLACQAESDTGLTGGTQDQLASVHGGAGMVLRYQDRGRRTPIDADLPALGERLILVHGAGSRSSGAIIEKVLYERPRTHVMRVIKSMNQTGELLAQSLAAGDHDQIDLLINDSTRLLGELHDGIVDSRVVRWLFELGATASKPCGAGGPGAVWATMVDTPAQPAFIAGVQRAGWSVLTAKPSSSGVSRRAIVSHCQDDLAAG